MLSSLTLFPAIPHLTHCAPVTLGFFLGFECTTELLHSHPSLPGIFFLLRVLLRVRMAGSFSSRHECGNSDASSLKRPSLSLQLKYINHCLSYYPIFFIIPIIFWNFLIHLFMNTACFLPQNISSIKAETCLALCFCPLGLTSQDFNKIF